MFKAVCRYILSVAVYIVALPLSSVAAVLLPVFTRAQPAEDGRVYTWGWLFGTYDNPPQGDRGWVNTRSYFPGVTTGFKGYLNRVGWLRRNRLYGLKRLLGTTRARGQVRTWDGVRNVSDKYKVPGTLKVTLKSREGLRAFEYYAVLPYSKTRCVRIRLGWKIKGDKFDNPGDFAPLVFTVNPFDSYGD